jgi:predicted 2-oxoglutarate/Fe(II)-dependent dioxygenase YbiX
MKYEEKIRHDFQTKNYAHLKGLLDLDNCRELTNELRVLVKNNSTQKDTQCPLSEAIHGAPVFDSLLEQLTPHFELASGKRLFPTYAYARLYSPGEMLKVHTDRPSCEISATVTLGFNGKVWPIFLADATDDNKKAEKLKVPDEHGKYRSVTNVSKVKMEIGDAVLYRGMDKIHWRDKYKEGEWQAQVFLHYVDADGPHAEWKYDKRPRLNHHAIPDYSAWAFPDALTKDACKKIIESVEKQAEGEDAQIGGGNMGVVDKTIRDVRKINLPTHRGIGATMAGMALSANMQCWKFDITHPNQCDYLRYDKEGHYKAHVDTFMNPGDPQTRKLTVLAFLNDDFEGGRLFLQQGDQKTYPSQEPGTVIVFPSYIMHGVEPVTSGVRRSIVTWMVGPWFK